MFFFCYSSSWLYNLFSKFINKALKSALEKQVCDDGFLPVLLDCCRWLNRSRSILFKRALHCNWRSRLWTGISLCCCCRSALWWITLFLTWTLVWRHSTVRHPPAIKRFYIRLYLKSWQKSYCTAVLAKVDKHAEIEYSMVSSPDISTSSINLKLKVKENFTTNNQ